MAAAYGVAPRTVLRWIDGTRKGSPALRARLQAEAAAAHQPRVKNRLVRDLRSGHRRPPSVRIDRADTFAIRGSDALRRRAIYADLTIDQATALLRAASNEEAQAIVEQAIIDYLNGGSGYGGFRPGDITFNPHDVEPL